MSAQSRAPAATPNGTGHTPPVPVDASVSTEGDRLHWAYVGGALIGDLDLRGNLTFAHDCAGQPTPTWLADEIEALFAAAGVDLTADWGRALPAQADPLACLATRIGRALAADADGLTVAASEWPEDCLPRATFERAYRQCYPWRGLRWQDAATCADTPRPQTPLMPDAHAGNGHA